MSAGEIRVDPFSGAEVIVAPGRAKLGATRPGGLPSPNDRCPFCPGHESDTEETLYAVGDPWQVRVVRNRFPLVDESNGGRHELVVESRAHDVDLVDLDVPALSRVLHVYRERLRVLSAFPGVEAVTLFRNRGRRAGSSQPHPHAQLVALPFVPPNVRQRDAIALRTPDLLAHVLDDERRDGARIVRDDAGWVTLCPYASLRSHEVRIAPSFACERFASLDDQRIEGLAEHLALALRALKARMGLADYNLLVRDPATRTHGTFFTVDLLPRTGGDAGFEVGSGVSVCVISPEETAAALRASL